MTMQMCPRKSKQSRRCMHRFRFSWSFAFRVDNTRSSIREASRYFWTDLMILIATSLFLLRSRACTTFPSVPWPKSFVTESASWLVSRCGRSEALGKLTSFSQLGIWHHNVVPVIVIDLAILSVRGLFCCQYHLSPNGFLGTHINHLFHLDIWRFYRGPRWRLVIRKCVAVYLELFPLCLVGHL